MAVGVDAQCRQAIEAMVMAMAAVAVGTTRATIAMMATTIDLTDTEMFSTIQGWAASRKEWFSKFYLSYWMVND